MTHSGPQYPAESSFRVKLKAVGYPLTGVPLGHYGNFPCMGSGCYGTHDPTVAGFSLPAAYIAASSTMKAMFLEAGIEIPGSGDL